MAKKNKPEGKKYSYMDTYGDLVTLLLCFFVLLFAMSTIEEEKFNAFANAMQDRFGGGQQANMVPAPVEDGSSAGTEDPAGSDTTAPPDMPADLQQLSQSIAEYIEENNLQGSVSVSKSESGATFVRLSGNMLFAGDRADLTAEIREFLDFFAAALKEVEDQVLQVRFLGHTGTIPGSPTDDWLLSAERAGVVSSYVERSGGFTRFKINSQFFGRNYPIADNATAAGLAQNRRVDIVILSRDVTNATMTLADALRVYFPGDDMQYYEGAPNELPENILQPVAPNGGGEELGGSAPTGASG